MYITKPIYVSQAVIKQDITFSNQDEVSLKNKVVFIGSFDHFPNRDGVVWFLENCWQIIIAAKPDIQFDIIGTGWTFENLNISKPESSQITCKGFVDNLYEAIHGCVMIVPIRIGSGMRMKILDGISYGCPIVTTTIGTEGIELTSNTNCFIEDKAKDFARAIICLLENKNLAKSFLQNMKKIPSFQNQDVLIGKRLKIYAGLINN